jgi:predicted GNAT superfamily acetyltransferase
MTDDSKLVVRRLHATEDLAKVEELYRTVFGLNPVDGAINARLLTAIDRNSGAVVGALHGSDLVGFAFGFLAQDGPDGELYHYSQTAAVLPALQSKGVGRLLKMAQRAECLSDGVRYMRWAYDPMQARNAHFNLDVLGATVRALIPDMYGGAAPRRDAGDSTDRFVVRWDLDHVGTPRSMNRLNLTNAPQLAEARETESLLAISIPSNWDSLREQLGIAAALEVRRKATECLQDALDRGYVGVSCQRIDAERAMYVFVPAAAVDSADYTQQLDAS